MRLPSPPLRSVRATAPTMLLGPSALLAEASATVGSLTTTGWDGPGLIASGGKCLSYWDLHGFLLLPTLWLLTAGSPALLDDSSDPLKRRASFAFVAFILSIAVGQAFVWDSVGAQIGIWEFNPEKCTGLGESTLLPLEEILWLFHHVINAALWQLKIAEGERRDGRCPTPSVLPTLVLLDVASCGSLTRARTPRGGSECRPRTARHHARADGTAGARGRQLAARSGDGRGVARASGRRGGGQMRGARGDLLRPRACNRVQPGLALPPLALAPLHRGLAGAWLVDGFHRLHRAAAGRVEIPAHLSERRLE